jgi:hypothetical protein
MNQPDERATRRERLLALEPETPALRADYQRKVNAMLEVPLSRARRLSLVLVLAGAVASAALLAALLLTETVPGHVRLAFAVGIAFALAWAMYSARILRRGVYRRTSDSTAAAGMAFGFTMATAVGFALAMGRRLDPFLMFGFLFVLPAAVILLRTVVEQAELRTHERILELEYRLARLSEGLARGGPDRRDDPAAGGPR